MDIPERRTLESSPSTPSFSLSRFLLVITGELTYPAVFDGSLIRGMELDGSTHKPILVASDRWKDIFPTCAHR
jgi:hypothetical protein